MMRYKYKLEAQWVQEVEGTLWRGPLFELKRHSLAVGLAALCSEVAHCLSRGILAHETIFCCQVTG